MISTASADKRQTSHAENVMSFHTKSENI